MTDQQHQHPQYTPQHLRETREQIARRLAPRTKKRSDISEPRESHLTTTLPLTLMFAALFAVNYFLPETTKKPADPVEAAAPAIAPEAVPAAIAPTEPAPTADVASNAPATSPATAVEQTAPAALPAESTATALPTQPEEKAAVVDAPTAAVAPTPTPPDPEVKPTIVRAPKTPAVAKRTQKVRARAPQEQIPELDDAAARQRYLELNQAAKMELSRVAPTTKAIPAAEAGPAAVPAPAVAKKIPATIMNNKGEWVPNPNWVADTHKANQ